MPETVETTENELLVAADLHKSFRGVPAVRGVSFSLQAGETVAFLGPNGAGKSTTLRMIAGYLDPDSGSVRICGRHLDAARKQAQTRLGYLAEGAPLHLDLSASAYLSYLARMHSLTAAVRTAAVERVADNAMITDIMDRPLGTLSKGYRRRVALAGALVHDPDVLILDEPTDGLDPLQKQAMRDWLSRIRAQKAILISTHQLEEVAAMCPRAIVIADGRIVADGSTSELLGERPAEAFSALTANTSPGEGAAA